MRNFHLLRTQDASGVSGTGIIAEGVVFANGHCVLNWLTKYDSLGVYRDLTTLEAIHGHGAMTKVIFDNVQPVTGSPDDLWSSFECPASFYKKHDIVTRQADIGGKPYVSETCSHCRWGRAYEKLESVPAA